MRHKDRELNRRETQRKCRQIEKKEQRWRDNVKEIRRAIETETQRETKMPCCQDRV
jgi:hypothetical protein